MTMDNGMDASPSWEELMKECRSLREQVKRLNAKLEDIDEDLERLDSFEDDDGSDG